MPRFVASCLRHWQVDHEALSQRVQTMPLMVTENELEQVLQTQSFIHMYGFKLVLIGEGTCTLAIPFQSLFARPGGYISGPVYMAAADVAMWFAVMTRLGMEGRSSDGAVGAAFFTSDMQTAFLSAAKGEDITCTATLLKIGRRLIYGVAECRTNAGKLLTHHTISCIRPDSYQPTDDGSDNLT